MKLYDYGASCNCYKVRLLLAHLASPYQRVRIDIFAGETLTDEYARINPHRTTPVLETEDGRFLIESGAILLYLGAGTPYLPADRFDLAQVVRWLIYEQTDVMQFIGGLRFRLLTGRLRADDVDALRRRRGATQVLSHLDAHLAASEYLIGPRYTIADIAVYGYTHLAHEAGLDPSSYEHLRRWLARVEGQPGYIEDVEPYGANAAPGAGRSVYG